MRHVIDILPRENYFERTENFVRYCEDIRKFEVLTLEEERKLFDKIKTGSKEEREDAERKIIEANQRFVVAVAKAYARNDNLMDLIEEGNIGMLEAIRKFDTSYGVKFISFAVWYLRRAISSYIITKDRTVRPSNVSKVYHLKSSETSKFIQREQRNPTEDELLDLVNDKLESKVKHKRDIRNVIVTPIDFDWGDGDARNDCNNETLVRTASVNSYDDEAEQTHQNWMVRELLKVCTKQEKDVICYKFGIDCERPYSTSEVAEKLGRSAVTIKHIERKAMRKLKSAAQSVRGC
jgi:RNA polymerase primary sigma factor